jgi:acyl-CoA thioesterase YciA
MSSAFMPKSRVSATRRLPVNVEVYAERNYADPITVKVTEAQLTYVAIDSSGKKRDVPLENT